MPHGGYGDEDVEVMYKQISSLLQEARKSERIILLSGDWNAEVQSDPGPTLDSAVGPYANASGNQRGMWLANWAQKENLAIANTFFRKRWGKVWTHSQNGRRRQIDYCMVEKKRWSSVEDARSGNFVDMGSDHRGVKVILDMGPAAMKKRKRFKALPTGGPFGWRPVDVDRYKKSLDACLNDLVLADRLDWVTKSIDEKLKALEGLVVKTARLCKASVQSANASKEELLDHLKNLLDQRRAMTACRRERDARAILSKSIQKEMTKYLKEKEEDQDREGTN